MIEMKPTVFLSFDDFFVDQWVFALSLFARYNARVTFFLNNFDTFTDHQIEGLWKLKEAGHTIGCHGLRHERAVDYMQAYSIEKYWQDDVEPAIKLMEKVGFKPTCFSYPFSQNNEQTDTRLLEYFEHLRSGVSLSDNESIFVPVDEIKSRGCFYGLGIDSNSKVITDDQIYNLMTKAKDTTQCITFYAHSIAETSEYHHIRPERLEKILSYGNEIDIRFRGFDDID